MVGSLPLLGLSASRKQSPSVSGCRMENKNMSCKGEGEQVLIVCEGDRDAGLGANTR